MRYHGINILFDWRQTTTEFNKPIRLQTLIEYLY